MSNWVELFTLLSAFVASSFALVRYSFSQQKSMADRLVDFLEHALNRQEEINNCFQPTISDLSDNVRENSLILSRILERLSAAQTKEQP